MVTTKSSNEIIKSICKVIVDIHPKGEHKRDAQIPFVKH